jgi:hypothetical protein
MPYIFRGRLCGYICAECLEPLFNVKVRLYRSAEESARLVTLAVADPKETFAILSDEQVREKESRLIAEAQTDDDGNFSFEFENRQYDGEAFEVDVYCGTVPYRKEPPEPIPPVQFSITTLQPRWRRSGDGAFAVWDYCIPYRYWCGVRTRFGAWTICGRFTTCDRPAFPIPGATVRAFDADWLQDDPLGSAVTDSDGRFRINYSWEDFQTTPFSPLINFEWVGGPDVYFIAELGGDVLLDEHRSIARTPGRENVGHCFCVELCTEKEPKILIASIVSPVAHACVQSQQFPTCGTGSAPLNGIEITGTAAGPPFDHYTLRYSYGGPIVNQAVVYPNCDRPPAPASSSTQVLNGRLGWLDVNLLPPGVTEFTVYLDVFDSAAGTMSDTRTFTVKSNAIEISSVAQLNVVEGEDPFPPHAVADPPNPQVKLVKATNDPLPTAPEVSVGGGFSLGGSAYTVGCDRILREFKLARVDAPPASDAPTPTDASGATPLFPPSVQPVVYDDTTDHPWQSGCSFPTPNTILNGFLTSQWSVDNCPNPSPPPLTYPIPKVKAISGGWNSNAGTGLNGRFVLLLEVKDNLIGGGSVSVAGVDRVVVWIDNKVPEASITSIGGIAPCVDLHLKDYVGTRAEIRGIAWDPPIDPTAPQKAPNDNFGSYGLSFQKNGGAGGGIAIEASPSLPPTTFGSNIRVPNEWPARVAADGKLTDWDIVNALDLSSPTPLTGIPDAAKLPRGARCAYVIRLGVSDATRVGDGGGGHSTPALYAVNIINDVGT